MNRDNKKVNASSETPAPIEPEVVSAAEMIENPQEDIRISAKDVTRDPKPAIHKANCTKGPVIVSGTTAIGAVIGSVIPGLGTMIGAGLGGILGGAIVVAKGIKNKRNAAKNASEKELDKHEKPKLKGSKPKIQ